MAKRRIMLPIIVAMLLSVSLMITNVHAETQMTVGTAINESYWPANSWPVAGRGPNGNITCRPSAWSTNSTVAITNPTYAYDTVSTTYALFTVASTAQQKSDRWFDVSGFNHTIPGNYEVVGIDVKMNYSTGTVPGINSYYRILAWVGSRSTEMLPWSPTTKTTPSVSTDVRLRNVREPNDGLWNWTDIGNLRIRVEGKNLTRTATGTFREYETWITIPVGRFVLPIEAAEVSNLYTWQAKLNFTATLLNATRASEGPFLFDAAIAQYDLLTGENGSTDFTVKIFNEPPSKNYVALTCTMKAPALFGADGSGVLAWVEFRVEDYGYSDMVLWDDLLLNSNLFPIDHTLVNGYFRNGMTGDANLDKSINVFDILAVKSVWGKTPASPGWIREYDVNNDNTINVFDILTVKANWGRTAP